MNKTDNWDILQYPYIDLTPDSSCDESARAWQGCPSVAVTKGGRVFAAWYTGGAFEPCINNYNLLVKSDDGGESFFTTTSDGKPDRCVYDEIALYERTPNELYYIARTNRGYYLSGVSKDGGNSWSRAEKYEDAPSSRAYIGVLGDGIVAYARNVSDKSRVGIKLCLSEDGGVSFPYEMMLDSRERVSYPDVAQDERGNIYVIYDRERDNRIKLDRETWHSDAAKEILLCRVTADDVRSGKLSDGSYLAHVISRAGQDEVLL